jgi:flagellar L-ring protein precursor FlgH
MIRFALVLIAIGSVAGCATQQEIREIGRAPSLSPVGSGIPETVAYTYPEAPTEPKKFSLWDDRQSRLFTDARALSVGDILTVKIEINDRAKFKNETERNRKSKRDLGFGLGASWEGIGTEGEGQFDISSGTDTQGAGATARSENIELLVAAVVTEVMPNGNLMISGSQEVRVNHELRILTIAGMVRPSDIGAANTISYDRIAEARISYGGRGRLTEVQQPAYGQQIMDHILPF